MKDNKKPNGYEIHVLSDTPITMVRKNEKYLKKRLRLKKIKNINGK